MGDLPKTAVEIDLVQAGYLLAIMSEIVRGEPDDFVAKSLFTAVKEAAARLLLKEK